LIMKTVPKLRFREFNDNWTRKTLFDISENVGYGMNSAAVDFDGVHKYIRITDIDEMTGAFKPNPQTSPDGEKDDKYKLKKGDIVFARTGASVGKSYLYNPTDGNLYYAGFLIRFSIRDANPYFIYSHTLKESYNKWVHIYSMRSGQPGLNAEEYKALKLSIPSLPEQQKIASFLTAVDEKIQQLTRKKEFLEQYKKGVMQQLFSGKLRFKDENGRAYVKWEKKRLDEFCEINPSTGELPQSFIYVDLESVVKGQLIQEKRIHKEDAPSRAQRKLQPQDILYQTVRPYQMNNYLFDKEDDYVASTGYAQIRTSQNTQYVFQILHSESFMGQVLERCTGTSFPAINSKDLGKIKVPIPNKKEQQKIASFLSGIDSKVETVSKQIGQSQIFKKGLLQQMFV
jgi:type I restriction enzyme S subunit